MQTKTKPRRIALLLAMYGALIIFLSATNPKTVSSIFLVLPVLWLFSCLFLTLIWFVPQFRREIGVSGSFQSIARAAILAGVPSGLLLLQSINQLTLKDIMLLALFGAVALVYSKRFQLQRKRE